MGFYHLFLDMNAYEQLDQARRWQGEVMDSLGLGPEETPSRIVATGPLYTLKGYGDARGKGPVILIVPASIKRAYIWDLAPRMSVVREFLSSSMRVYLIQWERPGPGDQGFGLESYADTFILSVLDAIASETGEGRAFLAGHSLGGTFAAIFASLHGDRTSGLVLIGAPISFGPGKGALDTFVAAAPEIQEVTGVMGNVPGSFLSSMSAMASSRSFRSERMEDWITSLQDVELLQRHLMVERWTLDEMPQPRKLFKDVVEDLYRKNLFMRGELTINGRRAAPSSVTAPVLTIADERSDVVTPESSLQFYEGAGTSDTQVLWYGGDVGVALQHEGMLVGRNAHRFLWPEIIAWIRARNAGG
jgi:polyhydroxyalkanoate synthase subunit PhaC